MRLSEGDRHDRTPPAVRPRGDAGPAGGGGRLPRPRLAEADRRRLVRNRRRFRQACDSSPAAQRVLRNLRGARRRRRLDSRRRRANRRAAALPRHARRFPSCTPGTACSSPGAASSSWWRWGLPACCWPRPVAAGSAWAPCSPAETTPAPPAVRWHADLAGARRLDAHSLPILPFWTGRRRRAHQAGRVPGNLLGMVRVGASLIVAS